VQVWSELSSVVRQGTIEAWNTYMIRNTLLQHLPFFFVNGQVNGFYHLNGSSKDPAPDQPQVFVVGVRRLTAKRPSGFSLKLCSGG
jgi:hypothetical protein